MEKVFKTILILLISTFIFNSCSSPVQSTPVVEDQVQATAAATAEPVKTYSLWVAPYLPQEIQDQLSLPQNVFLADEQDEANIWLDIGSDQPISQWIYVLAAPFPTIADSITFQEVLQVWNGQAPADSPVQKILVDGKTKAVFEKVWGTPSGSTVVLTNEEDLLNDTWAEDDAWAIIPFDALELRWKVITVNGISPLDDDFNTGQYALSVTYSLLGKAEDLQAVTALIQTSGSPLAPSTNRDESKLTTVDMTGVTALVRGTAYMMEKYGMTYPALDIGDILRSADILHVSNEIPFTETCPNPFYNSENDQNLVFCSKPEYIKLLESIGTDVVELTGDHFRDWGADAMLYTLSMYEERGWKYYGGGHNLADGQEPALFEHNGNKIAFLGCNAKPEGYATADEDSPGAVHCDLDKMSEQIKELNEQGYITIVTFQHIEYYAYTASPYLVEDFHKVAEAGAAIVSGSQAHQPHAFEFYKGAFLHYGLGNLFFDQYNEGTAQRQAFIDRYVIYDGRVISSDLITTEFVDMARSRLMTEEERQELLETVFTASGW